MSGIFASLTLEGKRIRPEKPVIKGRIFPPNSRYAFEVVHIHIPLRETKRKQSAPPKTSSPGETQWEITDATGHRPRHHQPN
jgi:hypothetical protein